jgi:hypothetical protein
MRLAQAQADLILRAMADVLSNLVEAGAIGSSTHAAQEGSGRATGR